MTPEGRELRDQLLGIETDELLSFRFARHDLLLWPYVRWLVLWRGVEQALSTSPPVAASGMSLWQRGRYLAEAALHNPFRSRRPFDLVFFASGVGQSTQRQGRWFDRISDYFVEVLPERSLSVDGAVSGRFRRPRAVPFVTGHDWLFLRAALPSIAARRPHDTDRDAIRRLIAHLRPRLPRHEESVWDAVRQRLELMSARLPALEAPYRRFFEQTRPRLVFLEDGSYGPLGHILKWAGDVGARTAELQHGVIHPLHFAYQHTLSSEPYAAQLPGSLLCYGDFWRRIVATPSHPVVIGSPHFASRREQLGEPPSPGGGPRRVLVVSQGDSFTERLVDLAGLLARDGCEVWFRPHPLERGARRLPGLRLSDGDLYQALHHTDVVVGISSTVLYEAAGLGRPTYVLDNLNSRLTMSPDVGTWFHTAEELRELLRDPPPPVTPPEGLFASDWRSRYRGFLAEQGLLN